MPLNDVREFIAALKGAGELVEINQEVDWNLEVGAIMRRANELGGQPAQLFNKIKGYPPGYRVSGGLVQSYSRLARALELDPKTTYPEILDAYDLRIQKPVKPKIVDKDQAPCKQNIQLGDDINIYKFPSPMPHDGDGGRFIGTWHATVCKDPDSDWVNWGMYRHMVHNRKTLGCLVIPHQHIGRIFYEKYEERNQPMEVAIAFGGPPVCPVAAATDFPYGMSEVEIAGGLVQRPIEMVKCETVNLHVPATSEIVIEGIMPPGVRVDEGPFGEYTGYRASPRAPRPIIQVTAVTHRTDPILTYACMGMPIDEGDVVCSVGHVWDMRQSLRKNGLPITGIYSPPESAQLIAVVSTRTPYANIASQIAASIWGTKGAGYYPMVIVTNDDVDIYNIAEVMHALCSKLHPVRGITVIPHGVGSPLLPMLNLEERLWSKGSKVLFDCTWPLDWPQEIAVPPKASFRDIYPERIKQKVVDNWTKYGFKG